MKPSLRHLRRVRRGLRHRRIKLRDLEKLNKEMGKSLAFAKNLLKKLSK